MSSPISVRANRREFLQGVGGLTLVIGSTGLITACSTEEAEQIAQSGGHGSHRQYLGNDRHRRRRHHPISRDRDGSGHIDILTAGARG